MKLLGRIFLITAAVLLLVVAVPNLIDIIKYFNSNGWHTIFANTDNATKFGSLIGYGINCLLALTAIGGAIRGSKSFGLALTAIILMIAPTLAVINLVQANNGGVPLGQLFSLIGGYLVPIFYFLGFLFI